jgi:hypothetical protein
MFGKKDQQKEKGLKESLSEEEQKAAEAEGASEKADDAEEVAPESVEEAYFSFETIEKVSFNINGKPFEGTKFRFDSEEVAEARKKMLIERHGKRIIK